jgi:monooxygenase
MSTHHFDVLIIGAGLSGIGVACQISTAFPDRTLAILERRERLGGTWDLFRYPGIRSDSDMFTYGYSFRPWTSSTVLADGSSIREYLADTAREFGIDDKIRYDHTIASVDWSSAVQRWTVTALESSGEVRTYTCRFLVGATGYYDHDAGYQPEFPGAERFGGRLVHPQHWPADLDHSGKQVVVIGSGATAVTLVPAMAGEAAHVTMLQRSPSYIFSVPARDKISEALSRVLPQRWVYSLARKRNIATQRWIYRACKRWPRQMRRLLLGQVRRKLGASVDMQHFTPTYQPWDERLCAVPDADLFEALKSGEASIVTDQIESFTETGIALRSGRHLEADVIVSATGLRLQMLGGITVSVDGVVRELHEQMSYKGVLLQDIPNMAWVFGYTNASWTLKSDLTGAYVCRLLQHLDDHGLGAVTPRDLEGCTTQAGMLDCLSAGYVQRGKNVMPRQGAHGPWQVRMDYAHDSTALLDDPVVDGVLQFEAARTAVEVAA